MFRGLRPRWLRRLAGWDAPLTGWYGKVRGITFKFAYTVNREPDNYLFAECIFVDDYTATLSPKSQIVCFFIVSINRFHWNWKKFVNIQINKVRCISHKNEPTFFQFINLKFLWRMYSRLFYLQGNSWKRGREMSSQLFVCR